MNDAGEEKQTKSEIRDDGGGKKRRRIREAKLEANGVNEIHLRGENIMTSARE